MDNAESNLPGKLAPYSIDGLKGETAILQFIGTIAVVVSVLVLAYHTRDVARQTRLANEVAGTVAHRDLVFNWRRWAHVFIDHPELHAMHFSEADTEPSDADRVKLAVTAEAHADWLEAGLTTEQALASYEFVTSIGYWGEDYVPWVLASTPGLRQVMRDQPDTWPQLNAYLERHDSQEHEQNGV
jgi:hypothetical protein